MARQSHTACSPAEPSAFSFISTRARAHPPRSRRSLLNTLTPVPTSNSRYRLSLRADNADLRLTSKGFAAGCVSPERHAATQHVHAQVSISRTPPPNCPVPTPLTNTPPQTFRLDGGWLDDAQ